MALSWVAAEHAVILVQLAVVPTPVLVVHVARALARVLAQVLAVILVLVLVRLVAVDAVCSAVAVLAIVDRAVADAATSVH